METASIMKDEQRSFLETFYLGMIVGSWGGKIDWHDDFVVDFSEGLNALAFAVKGEKEKEIVSQLSAKAGPMISLDELDGAIVAKLRQDRCLRAIKNLSNRVNLHNGSVDIESLKLIKEQVDNYLDSLEQT